MKALPPKPTPREGKVSLWRYMKLFRKDILSAQPERLYHAWMAAFRTPFFRSFLINDRALISAVLLKAPQNYPKSDRVTAGLKPLLGNSVFVTNGAEWERQRRIIDPAFSGGRLQETLPAMQAALSAAIERLGQMAGPKPIEIEEFASHLAADVIFRTLFSMPIEDAQASAVYHAFRAYQRRQPVLNIAALIPFARRLPRVLDKQTMRQAQNIRALIRALVAARLVEIKAGTAPDDLATKILTTSDPVTGQRFNEDEMLDQVAIFFLAGHETSAAALSWGLYLLATHPDWQDAVAGEAATFDHTLAGLRKLVGTRDVFRETLRLYPPVPMMVREARAKTRWRGRRVPRGAQVVISLWHLHRHQRLWRNADAFDPARWQRPDHATACRDAFMPFSAGPRICTGAGFAMVEGTVLLSGLVGQFRFAPVAEKTPIPEAHLTVRSRDGIWLRCQIRQS